MTLAGSDENTRPMRRVRLPVGWTSYLDTGRVLASAFGDGNCHRGTTESSPWSGTRPFGVGEVAG